jgi:hypothetical protein
MHSGCKLRNRSKQAAHTIITQRLRALLKLEHTLARNLTSQTILEIGRTTTDVSAVTTISLITRLKHVFLKSDPLPQTAQQRDEISLLKLEE